MFLIRLGVPEIEELWKKLTTKFSKNIISKDEEKLYKQIGKAEIARRLKEEGFDNTKIAQITDLSIEEVEEM